MSFMSGKVYVPNEGTALTIAEAIWLPIYGSKIYTCKPFIAGLNRDVWIVEGTLHAQLGMNGAGRVATFKPAVSTTFYEVSDDHLGNVRGVIGKTSTEVFATDFETEGNAAFAH